MGISEIGGKNSYFNSCRVRNFTTIKKTYYRKDILSYCLKILLQKIINSVIVESNIQNDLVVVAEKKVTKN